MIIVEDKSIEKVYYFPKNEDDGNAMLLQLFSELTHLVTTFQVENIANNRLYYGFSLDFSDVADGEYQYSILNEYNEVLEKGIIRIGDYSSGDVIYDLKEEYYVYNPELGDVEVVEEVGCSEKINEAYAKGYADGYDSATPSEISLETDTKIPNTAETISYIAKSTRDWVLKFYLRHHTQTEWTLLKTEEHTERDKYKGTIEIGQNYEGYPKHFKIVVYTTDEEATDSKEIEQDMTIYFDVDVYSPSSALPWSASELSYGIQYSEYQSVHTGTFYIYKNGELYLKQPFGWYPYGFATYTQIPQNNTFEPITWTITGILDNGQQDTCEVVQEATENPYAVPFTIEMLEEGYVTWKYLTSPYLTIRINGEETQIYDESIRLNQGDEISFVVKEDRVLVYNSQSITGSGKQKVKGNIMSLLYPNYVNETLLTHNYAFNYLFYQNTALVDASELLLPPTTCEFCYGSMFRKCTSLTEPPVLPSMQLAEHCYSLMFEGCTALTEAPELPATELVKTCYSEMFENCTALTAAPLLPATELVDFCYSAMFYGCTNLSYVKCLAEGDTLHHYKTSAWLRDVSNTGTFVKKRGVEYAYGVNGIPSNWTVEEID